LVFCWNPEKDRHTCRIIMNITVFFSHLATCKTYRMKVYNSSIELPCSSVYSYISMCSEFGSWNSGRIKSIPKEFLGASGLNLWSCYVHITPTMLANYWRTCFWAGWLSMPDCQVDMH
jgi:hypothetical protein